MGQALDGGLWTDDDLRRAFVTGAKWWEYQSRGATMWQSDQRLAEEEAERRYPDGKPRPTVMPQSAEEREER